jgi:hypothetical protein
MTDALAVSCGDRLPSGNLAAEQALEQRRLVCADLRVRFRDLLDCAVALA